MVNFWNSVPEDMVFAPSVNSFQGRFDKHYAHLRYCTEYWYCLRFLREKISLQVYWPTWTESRWRWWWTALCQTRTNRMYFIWLNLTSVLFLYWH